MTPRERIRFLREAGEIKRCHNVPHHGEYSVGKHSYNVVTILLQLHPNPSMKLIRAALWHDAPERYLGDLPAPAKWYNPELATQYKFAERAVCERTGLQELFELGMEDQMWLNAADRLELLHWARDQIAMGNQHVVNLRDNVRDWFTSNRDLVPNEIWEEVNNTHWMRGKEG